MVGTSNPSVPEMTIEVWDVALEKEKGTALRLCQICLIHLIPTKFHVGCVPSGNQTWLAGKSPMNGGVNRTITYKWSIFHCHV